MCNKNDMQQIRAKKKILMKIMWDQFFWGNKKSWQKYDNKFWQKSLLPKRSCYKHDEKISQKKCDEKRNMWASLKNWALFVEEKMGAWVTEWLMDGQRF